MAEAAPKARSGRRLSRPEVLEILDRNAKLYKGDPKFASYLSELALYLLEFEYHWAHSDAAPPAKIQATLQAEAQAAAAAQAAAEAALAQLRPRQVNPSLARPPAAQPVQGPPLARPYSSLPPLIPMASLGGAAASPAPPRNPTAINEGSDAPVAKANYTSEPPLSMTRLGEGAPKPPYKTEPPIKAEPVKKPYKVEIPAAYTSQPPLPLPSASGRGVPAYSQSAAASQVARQVAASATASSPGSPVTQPAPGGRIGTTRNVRDLLKSIQGMSRTPTGRACPHCGGQLREESICPECHNLTR